METAMNDLSATPGPSRQPVIIAKDGKAFTTSRDVAAFFEKEHRNVLQSIDKLLADEPDLGEGGMLNFEQTPYIEETTGQTYRMYEMTRDGFMLLAMGFTGKKAMKWKLTYIAAFNKMEATLQSAPAPTIDVNNKAQLQQIAMQLIEANERQEKQIESMKDDVAALDRIAGSDGMLSVTAAAKVLGMRPKDLFQWMASNGWAYKRPGASAWIGYASKCNPGYLWHNTTTIYRPDGTEKTTAQLMVTPKGLTVLAKLINPTARLI